MHNIIQTQLYSSMPLLLKGLGITMTLTICASIIGLSLGIIVGIFTCNRLRIATVALLLHAYVFCIRGIPFFLQLLIMYFVIPDLLGINFPPCAAGIVALGLCSTAYVAEIIRAGINAVPEGQWLASEVLGYSRTEALRYIILPQVIAHTIPTLTNELISNLLATSIISQIGTLELTKVGSNIVSREMNPMLIYTTIALMYLMVSSIILVCTKQLERRLNYAQRL